MQMRPTTQWGPNPMRFNHKTKAYPCYVHTDMYLFHFPKTCHKLSVIYEINFFPLLLLKNTSILILKEEVKTLNLYNLLLKYHYYLKA